MGVLVTGANGFVGAMLCRKLVEQGVSVRGLVRQTSDLSLLNDVNLEMVVGSLEDLSSLEKATEKIDTVYHVAAAVTDWGTYAYFHQMNVQGTQNLIQAAIHNKVKRFVLVSSVVVHNFLGQSNMDENSPQLPIPFPYSQTKREAESLVLSCFEQGKIDVTIVRPGDVYGPGDRVSLLKMAPLLEKGRMGLIGNGKKLGSFTYVENLVEGIILAGTKDEGIGETFIITDGFQATWREYFQKLTQALDVPPPRIFLHPLIAYTAASMLEGVYRIFRVRSRPLLTKYVVAHLWKDFHFSIDKARRILGYEPKITFDEAIQRTADWYIKVVRGGEK